MTRRSFSIWLGSGAIAASPLFAAGVPVRKLKVGHTGWVIVGDQNPGHRRIGSLAIAVPRCMF
jgi:hypothetical protein